MTITHAGVKYATPEGKVLLVRRAASENNAGEWEFPAGGIDLGENANRAALREFMEETGRKLDRLDNDLANIYSDGKFILYETIGALFEPKLSSEHDEFMWAEMSALPSPLRAPVARQLGQSITTMDSARQADINDFVTIVRNPISRAGVFQYMGSSIGGDAEPNKIYNVFRPAEALTDPEALSSFALMPIVDDHEMLGPKEKGLTPAEEKGTEGTTGEKIEFDPSDNTLYANLRIFSRRLLDKIQSGKIDLSMGYRCVYKKIAGAFQGMPYDYIQVSLRGNHLALVDEARCNVAVLDHRFTYDSRDIIAKGDSTMADNDKGAEGEKKKLDLSEVHSYMKENAPMWAELKELMSDKGAEDDDMDVGPSGDVTMDEEEEKKKAEEKEAVDKAAKDEFEKKDEKAMDAKDVARIAADAAVKAVGKPITFTDVAKEIAARDALYDKLSPVVGAFDHKEKTLAQVASYGVDKLGLKNVPKGQEVVALDGFFTGRGTASTRGIALDSKRAVTKNPALDKINAHLASA